MTISTLSPQTVRSLTAGTLLMVVSPAWAQCLGHGRFSTSGCLINEPKIWEDFLGWGLLCYPLVSFWSRHLLTSWNSEDVKVQIMAERMQFASHGVTGIVGLVLIFLDLVIWAHAWKRYFLPSEMLLMTHVFPSPMTLVASTGAAFQGFCFSYMVAGARMLPRCWERVDQTVNLLDKALVLQEVVLLERPKQKYKRWKGKSA